MRRLLAILVLFGSLSGNGTAATLRVSPSGDGTDGLSWLTAFNGVGDAIASATGGDQIWVASGTYNEAIELVPDISLYGGFFGNEDKLETRGFQKNTTTLDAGGLKSSVIVGASYCHVDGFTVTGGNPSRPGGGGGFYLWRVKCSISNCLITHNRAISATPEIVDGIGAGMSVIDSDVVITNCSFTNNVTFDGGGAVFIGSSGTFSNCLFSGNIGAALSESLSDIFVDSCTFGLDNFGIYISSRLDLDIDGSGSLFHRVSLRNCVTRADRIEGNSKRLHVSYSNIPEIPNVTGPGNIDVDPQWVDPENGDYRLRLGSPCIDSGSRAGPLTDLDGNPRPVDVSGLGHDGPGAFDMGAFEFQLSPADLDSNGAVDSRDLFLFEQQWREVE